MDNWIKCSDSKPEDCQTVLCHNRCTLLSGIPFIADYVKEFRYRNGTKVCQTGFYRNRELETVTHWQPLPAPPEE